jgi:hypothetical protein
MPEGLETLGIELAAFDPGDLRPDQCGAVLEILRAIRRPDFELSVVCDLWFPTIPSGGIRAVRAESAHYRVRCWRSPIC